MKNEKTITNWTDTKQTEKDFFEAFKTFNLTSEQESFISEIDLWKEVRQ